MRIRMRINNFVGTSTSSLAHEELHKSYEILGGENFMDGGWQTHLGEEHVEDWYLRKLLVLGKLLLCVGGNAACKVPE